MSLTARDLVRKIAKDAGCSYSEVAKRINDDMKAGKSLIDSIRNIATDFGLDPSKYHLSPTKIVKAIRNILQEDYSQTLMISAVLAQMVESKGRDRFPPPAFFAFMELLADTPEAARRTNAEPPAHVDEATTQIIELTTSLVSIICNWSETGIDGVAPDCPKELGELAKTVVLRTRLYQAGMWICLSCGKVVALRKTHSLLCPECDAKISTDEPSPSKRQARERHRIGYGRSLPGEEIE